MAFLPLLRGGASSPNSHAAGWAQHKLAASVRAHAVGGSHGRDPRPKGRDRLEALRHPRRNAAPLEPAMKSSNPCWSFGGDGRSWHAGLPAGRPTGCSANVAWARRQLSLVGPSNDFSCWQHPWGLGSLHWQGEAASEVRGDRRRHWASRAMGSAPSPPAPGPGAGPQCGPGMWHCCGVSVRRAHRDTHLGAAKFAESGDATNGGSFKRSSSSRMSGPGRSTRSQTPTLQCRCARASPQCALVEPDSTPSGRGVARAMSVVPETWGIMPWEFEKTAQHAHRG